MRVTLETDGGFAAIPGLRRAVTVDAASLPDAARAELASLVAGQAARAGAPPNAAAARDGARDARRYVLTIDDGGRQQTLHFSDPVADASLRALRDLVTRHGTPVPAGS